MTAAESPPRQISSAWLGPESAATRDSLPISLAMTSLMSRPDSGSMPLVRHRTGVSSAMNGAAWWQTLRRCVEGTAKMMASAPSSAWAKSVVATTFSGST